MLPLLPAVIVLGLLLRFALLPEGLPVRPIKMVMLGLLQAALLLTFGVVWQSLAVAGAYAVVVIATFYLMEIRPRREAPGTRLLLLLGNVAMVTFCFNALPRYQHVVPVQIPSAIAVWLGGALLCLKESNFFIRWFFARLKKRNGKSGNTAGDVAKAQTDNGRVIGALERLLVYMFLIAGHNVAIPVVIAVKALARFKKMQEDQAFAEYVIIGTFLSILLTFGIYAFVRQLIP